MWVKLEKKDNPKLLLYIQKHSPLTCPIFGNVSSAGFSYKPFAMRSGVFFIYKENGEILGVVAGFNDGNVMVHTDDSYAESTSFEIIMRFPFHSLWGLSSSLPDVKEVSKATKKTFDSRTLDVMVQKTKIQQLFCPDCTDIRIDKRFLTSPYVSFVKRCLWEGFGFKSGSYDIKKRIRERTEDEPYWFLCKDRKYVAQAHIHAMTDTHGYIGGICTPRDERRKGYAMEITKRACDYIYKQGRVPALAVSASNKAAYTMYEKLGFEKIATTLVYMLEREFKGDENEN